MEKKALIITVGGSDEPVVVSIKELKPHYIYFICSGGTDRKKASTFCVDGEGDICERKREIKCPKCKEVIEKGEKYPNIIKQSGYKGDFNKIELEDPDNFSEVFIKISEVIKDAKMKNYKILTDFTAGTKTMSSALAIASALYDEIEPYMVKGIRENTIKTTKGSMLINIKNHIEKVRIEIFSKIIDNLIANQLYLSANVILKEILKKGVNPELEKDLMQKSSVLDAFYNWDKFDYENAFEILKNFGEKYKEEFNYLKKILKKDKNSGYETVFDLFSNAKKQAKLGYYDNAVARLYRALELFAQIRLKNEYKIETNSLEKSLDKLKNKEKWEKKRNEKGEIKIGLESDYELLNELEDPIGKIYMENRNEFLNNIKIRNLSYLAHGNDPVKEEDWKSFLNFFEKFIKECCNGIGIKWEEVNLPKKI